MGWTFPYSTQTRADLVKYLRRPERFGEKLELVRASTSGNRHWYLIRERETGMHWIGLDLLQGVRGEGWGYKDLDESVGPCDCDVPESYLDAPHMPRDGWAKEWRERARAFHAARKARPKFTAGNWVQYGGRFYQLLESLGRSGWRVMDNVGDTYRMKAAQLRRAAPASTDAIGRASQAV